MMNFFRLFLLLISGWTVAMAQGECDLLIHNVNIIDVRSGTTLPNQFVYIAGDRISAITTGANPKFKVTTTIDGTGKFLIPGLWDMNTHNW